MTNRLSFAGFQPVAISGRTIRGSSMTEGPRRIVLDAISAPTVPSATISYQESRSVPHFTLDFKTQTVLQHLDMDETAVGVTALPLEPHRTGATLWVNILKPAGLIPDSEQSFWLGQMVGLIVNHFDVNEYWETFPSRADAAYRTSEMPFGEWKKFEGVCAAAHVPLCNRYGPGEVDLEAFGEGLGAPTIARVVPISAPKIEAETKVLEPEIVDPDLMGKLATELMTKPVEVETILGKFPGKKVQLGSGGKAVNGLREAYGIGKGKFDDDLHDHVTYAQGLAGLTQDGIVDAETWLILDRMLMEEE